MFGCGTCNEVVPVLAEVTEVAEKMPTGGGHSGTPEQFHRGLQRQQRFLKRKSKRETLEVFSRAKDITQKGSEGGRA